MLHTMAGAPFELTLEHEPDLPVEDSDKRVIFVYTPDFRVETRVLVALKAQTHPLTPDDIAQVLD